MKRTPEGVRGLIHRLGFQNLPAAPSIRRLRTHSTKSFSELAPAAVPDGLDPGKVKIWLQDDARAGQTSMLAQPWARRGRRP